MLDEKMVAEFVEKLRARAEEDPSVARDVLEVLGASYGTDRKEPVGEIAKTLCELLEPERVGGILWVNCKICGGRLAGEEEQERGTCSACLFGTGG